MGEYLTARHTGNAGIVIETGSRAAIEEAAASAAGDGSGCAAIEEAAASAAGDGLGCAAIEEAAASAAGGESGCAASLGIDVFCRDRKGLYMDTPEQERRRLLTDIGSGRLDTLVFTHAHSDHFCLDDVLEALSLNPKLHIISVQEVIRQIRAKCPDGILTEVSPAETGMVCIGVPGEGDPASPAAPGAGEAFATAGVPANPALPGGMKLTLFNAPHMGEQFSDVQNLVCLLEAGRKKLLIPGDARPDSELFLRTAGWSPVIDWIFVPFPVLGLPTSRRKMSEALTICHALAFHLPRSEKDIHGWRESAVKVCARAQDGLPEPFFGDVPGKTYIL